MSWRLGQSLSQDLRERVLAAVDGGSSPYEVATVFGVSVSYIYKALVRRRETGDSGPNPNRGHRPRALSVEQEHALAARIGEEPDITLVKLQAWLYEAHGVKLSSGAVWNAVDRLGLTYKKSLSASEQDRPDVAAARMKWQENQPTLDPNRLVFVDESGVNTKMVRLYGRAPEGERLRAKAPFGHWKTMTFVAALRYDGVVAPWLLDGAMDGDAFKTYISKVLVPTLRSGDIVVMDNLSSHKVSGVSKLIEEAGATILYLPPYSPDFNPIEMVFSKLKALLRSAKERTIRTLMTRIGEILGSITQPECAAYLRHAGYAHSM